MATDEFVVESATNQSLITTLQRFAAGVGQSPETPAGSAERALAIAETLNNLDQAENHIFGKRAQLGSRLNSIDSTRGHQESFALINEEVLSDLTDLDFNEAISRLTFQSFILEAAQQSFAKISNLSLFNFLR